MFLPGFASVSRSLADPSGSSALVAAVRWLEGTLLGTVATTVAVLAVSWVGLMMLWGRVDLRRGFTVIAGCFILFGASSIVAGIQATLAGADRTAYTPPPETAPPLAPPPAAPVPANSDPYAGASVPAR